MSSQIEEKDFAKIYQKTYFDTLKFITIRCYNIEDVNDILQDTYVEFFKILMKKQEIGLEQNQGFINGIAKNIIKRYFSKNKKHLSLVNEDGEDIEVMDDFDLEDDFMTKQNAKEIFDYIKNKDLLTAKIFYLYFIFDMKISKIAEVLNLNESTVKNRIYRSIKEIRKGGILSEE